MQAMRAGQPCLVHGVGGLNDTVRHGHNGFVFRGRDPREQARHMVATFEMAVARFRDEPEIWAQLVAQARSERFPWSDSVRQYERLLYGF
jgi:starch synthase